MDFLRGMVGGRPSLCLRCFDYDVIVPFSPFFFVDCCLRYHYRRCSSFFFIFFITSIYQVVCKMKLTTRLNQIKPDQMI